MRKCGSSDLPNPNKAAYPIEPVIVEQLTKDQDEDMHVPEDNKTVDEQTLLSEAESKSVQEEEKRGIMLYEEMLRMNKDDIYGANLHELTILGHTDRKLNRELLVKYNGNMLKVMGTLEVRKLVHLQQNWREILAEFKNV